MKLSIKFGLMRIGMFTVQTKEINLPHVVILSRISFGHSFDILMRISNGHPRFVLIKNVVKCEKVRGQMEILTRMSIERPYEILERMMCAR